MSQALIDLEDAWLDAAPRAVETRRAYRTELARLDRFLRSSGLQGVQLNGGLLQRFWRELTQGLWHEARQPPSASSLDQSRRILSAFIRWIVQQELGPGSLLKVVAGWRTPVRARAPEAGNTLHSRLLPVTLLLRVSDLDGAAASLCFWVGATPGELASLASANLDPSSAKVTLTQRGVTRTVAIPRPLARSLKGLMSPDQPWVFGRGGGQTTPAAMAQRVARWLSRHGGGAASSARALRSHFQRHAEARGWSSDEIRGQLRRPTLPSRPITSPTHRRLASLLPASL